MTLGFGRLQFARVIVAGFALTLVGASEASAGSITWELTGLVTAGDLKVPVGTSIEFTLTFDTAQPDQCAMPEAGFWSGNSTVQVFGSTFVATATGLEDSNPLGNCASSSPGGVVARLVGIPGAPFGNAAIETTSSLSPDIFPIDAFHTGDVFRFGPTSSIFFDGQGTVTTVTVTPEPTSLLLTATGVTWLIRRRRSARSQNVATSGRTVSPVPANPVRLE
jgi:hypothetical protein